MNPLHQYITLNNFSLLTAGLLDKINVMNDDVYFDTLSNHQVTTTKKANIIFPVLRERGRETKEGPQLFLSHRESWKNFFLLFGTSVQNDAFRKPRMG